MAQKDRFTHPVAGMGEPVKLLAHHLRSFRLDQTARNERIHPDAALPIRHLGAFLRVVVSRVAGAGEGRASVVGLVHPECVLPHAFGLERCNHLPDHAIHVVDHAVVGLAMVPAPVILISMTTCQIQTGWSPRSHLNVGTAGSERKRPEI